MLRVFAQTNVGMVREGNEDSFLVVDTTSEHQETLPKIMEYPSSENGLILMVSDGMGGAAAGEVASHLAVKTTMQELKFPSPPTAEEFEQGLNTALHTANRVIADFAERNPRMYGMGATATTIGVLKDQLFIGQVGDSRAYLIRGDDIEQLTRDQSFVNQLVEAGKITEEEAETHPRRNVILQALGNQPNLNVAITKTDLKDGDFILICSDGLSGIVKKEEMYEVVTNAENTLAACNQLVNLANQRGGHDNITIVLAEYLQAEQNS